MSVENMLSIMCSAVIQVLNCTSINQQWMCLSGCFRDIILGFLGINV